MSSLAVVMRRVVLIVMLAALGGAAWAWWRDRSDDGALTEPPSWPPLDPDPPAPSSEAASAAASVAATAAAPADAAVDAMWVAADDDGACPLTHPVKAKETSGIYHVTGGRMYERTKADRCYASTDAAERDGYRRSKT